MISPVHLQFGEFNSGADMKRRDFIWLPSILMSRAVYSASSVTVIDQQLSYPEGPLLIGDELFVADMLAHCIIVYDVNRLTRKRSLQFAGCGPTSLAPYGYDHLLVLCHTGGGLSVLDGSERTIASISQTNAGIPIRYPNDSVSDGRGGVFLSDAGIFSHQAPPTGAVLHVSLRAVRTVVSGLRYANGVAYDPQTRRLFVSEHLAGRIWQFQLDGNMRATERQLFFDLRTLPAPTVPAYDQMGPDGLELLNNGDLLAAQYGGGRFVRISADGHLRSVTTVPCQFVTNITRHQDDVFFVGAFDIFSQRVRGMLGKVALT